MAENDIYNNKKKYEQFKANLDQLLEKPSKNSKRKYFCRNPVNLQYFETLFLVFEAKDVSYIRRVRLLQTLKLITYATETDLACATRVDINRIVSLMHSIYNSPQKQIRFYKGCEAYLEKPFS